MMLEQVLMEENEKKEYRKMRRLYGVTDERTQMAKIRYLQMKDDTQRFICRTLHEHNMIVHLDRIMIVNVRNHCCSGSY